MRSQVGLRKITMNKASGGDGIPVELFQIIKDDAVKVLHSICQQIRKNSAVATEMEKVRFYSNPKERQCQRMLRLPHIAHISHASKAMLKILQARLQQYVNIQMFKLDLGKAKEPEIKEPTSVEPSIKQETPRKTSTSALLTMSKSLWLSESQQAVENSSTDGNARLPDLPPEKFVCRARSDSKNWTWKRLVPHQERSTSRLYIVTLLI